MCSDASVETTESTALTLQSKTAAAAAAVAAAVVVLVFSRFTWSFLQEEN